ncbi:MAG: thiol peroxidase [Desulfobacterales bacterium SG8_35]|nr:MAG: thiol peroxidase [Desulfobacterales bacterium SG8_35]
MAKITLQGNPVQTIGNLPAVGMEAPSFTLVKTDLSEAGLKDFAGKNIILNIFPSLDTSVCAASVRRFNKEASASPDTVVLCISADLPFAHKRFCEAEGLNEVIPLSVFRSPEFGRSYGVTFKNGPLAGLLSRAVVIIDKSGTVAYAEQVPEITQEPDYDAALLALSQLTG